MELDQINLALERICQNIGGNWVLLGGSLMRVDVDASRGTHDLDIVQIPLSANPAERTLLIQEMKAIGLSPEQVNSAVAFFLSRVPGWEQEIVELKQLGRGTIFRPNLTLFTFLKLQRGTDIDLGDVKKAASKWGMQEFNSERFKSWANPEIVSRAQQLGFAI